MKLKSKKFISLFLAFSLMAISCATITSPRMERRFPERKQGAIIITKKDGQQIRGELITVKPISLLLLDTEGKDVSINIADVKVIRIVKKSKAGTGVLIGLLIGGGGGALFWAKIARGAGDDVAKVVAIYGGATAAVGAIIGGVTGAVLGTDKTIQIEGMTDLEIKEAMDKLRKKARIPDYK